jgi:hypothetical protein
MAIRIPIITDFQGDGLEKTFEQFKKLESNAERASFALQKAFLPATAAIAGLTTGLVFSAKAAAEDQAAQSRLETQLKNSAGATDVAVKMTEEFITAMSNATATADDELRPALGNLVRATGDISTAQDLLKLSLDVSAGTGKNLAEVSDAVSKAYVGNTKAIKNLSPELFNLIKDGASADDIFKSLSQTFGGAAATAADTAQGKFKNLSIQLGEAQEAIGTALLPVLELLVGWLTQLSVWAQNNTAVIIGIGTAIGAIATAIILANGAMAAWKAVAIITSGINYALAASFTAVQIATGIGIAVVIAGIAAFALYKRSMNGLKADLEAASKPPKDVSDALDRMSQSTRSAALANEVLTPQIETTGAAVDKMAEKIKKARDELKDQFAVALDTAKDKLGEAQKAYDDFKTTVAESVTGEFSISGAADAAKEAGTSILAQLNEQAKGAKNFGKQVEQLLGLGISENALKHVLEAGQEAGSAIAAELIKGGSEAILGPNGINQIVSDLNFVADALGILAADQFYKAGVTQGQAMLQGISDAVAQAERKLKNPNLKLADLKGIGAGFASSTSSVNTTAPDLSTGYVNPFTIGSSGNIEYNIEITGGLATTAEMGRTVIDMIKAANRAYGPAAIDVL